MSFLFLTETHNWELGVSKPEAQTLLDPRESLDEVGNADQALDVRKLQGWRDGMKTKTFQPPFKILDCHTLKAFYLCWQSR